MNTTIYVTNFSGYTYDSAKEFGEEIVYMTNGFLDLTKMDELKSKIKEFIAKAEPSDYLIMSGNNLIAGYALHLWIVKFGFSNVLHWDSLRKVYIHYIV